MGLRLQQLAQQYPVANQQAAQGLEAANTMQLQKQVGAAAATGQQMTPKAIESGGAQLTGQQAQAGIQAQQQTVQQEEKLAQTGLQASAQTNQQDLFTRNLAVQKTQRQNEAAIFGLNQNLKSRLLDDQLSFQRDELGRTQFNERQLMDYSLVKAKNQEDFANYQQQVSQLSQRKMQALKTAQAKIEQSLQEQYTKSQTTQNNALTQQLVKAKMDNDLKMKQNQAEAANRAAMFGAAGSIAGVAIGAGVGTLLAPVGGTALGAAAGASIGGALGSGVGNIVAGQTGNT